MPPNCEANLLEVKPWLTSNQFGDLPFAAMEISFQDYLLGFNDFHVLGFKGNLLLHCITTDLCMFS